MSAGSGAYSDDVYGVEVEADRVAEASLELPNIQLAYGEALPFEDGTFDLVFSNEVIEHVDDDRQTIAEAVRVTRPGGSIVTFAPNRLYPFETHGAYIGGRYRFGNIPLVNWLPDPLRDRFVPHVRAYTGHGIRSLFRGQPVHLVHHGVIYPGLRQHDRPARDAGPAAPPGAVHGRAHPAAGIRPVPLPGGPQGRLRAGIGYRASSGRADRRARAVTCAADRSGRAAGRVNLRPGLAGAGSAE